MGMPVAKKCTQCSPPTYFETIAGYNHHIKEKHNSTAYIGTAFKCNKCTKFFDTCAAKDSHTCP